MCMAQDSLGHSVQHSSLSFRFIPGTLVRRARLALMRRAACMSLFLWTAGNDGIQLHAGSNDMPLKPRSESGISLKNFEAVDLMGKRWRFEQLDGKVTIIQFWATWCTPCRKEIESLRRIDKTYSGRGLQILGINLDSFDRPRLVKFLTVHRMDWPQIHEFQGFDGKAAKLFGIDTLPALFLSECSRAAIRLSSSSIEAAVANAMQNCPQ